MYRDGVARSYFNHHADGCCCYDHCRLYLGDIKMTPTNTPRDVTLPDKGAISEARTYAIYLEQHLRFAHHSATKAQSRGYFGHAVLTLNQIANAMGYRVIPLDAPEDATPQVYADLARVMGGKDTREDGE